MVISGLFPDSRRNNPESAVFPSWSFPGDVTAELMVMLLNRLMTDALTEQQNCKYMA